MRSRVWSAAGGKAHLTASALVALTRAVINTAFCSSSAQQHHLASTHHPNTGNPDQNIQHPSAEHLLHISAHFDRQASLTCRSCGDRISKSLPDFARSKTCIRTPTSLELYPHLQPTKHTTNPSSKWSTTLEPLPAVAPATTVSYSPAIAVPERSACCELGTEFCRRRSSASCAALTTVLLRASSRNITITISTSLH